MVRDWLLQICRSYGAWKIMGPDAINMALRWCGDRGNSSLRRNTEWVGILGGFVSMKNIDFKSGIIAYDYFDIVDPLVPYEQQLPSLDEDMLQVEYPHNYVLDIGWYHGINGSFVVRIIKDCDWDEPILRKETRNL